MKIRDKLLVIFLVMVTSVSSLQVVEAESIEDPEDLHWGNGSIIQMACWKRVNDDSIDYYKVVLKKNDSVFAEKTVKAPDDGYNFESDINEEGTYTFAVQAIPEEKTGKDPSNVISSPDITFKILDVEYKTVNEDGYDADSDGYGQIFIEDLSTGSGHQASYRPFFAAVRDDNMKVTIEAKRGYTVDSVTFDEDPSSLVIDRGIYSFKLDKSYKINVVFRESDEKGNVQVEFGKGHNSLAAEVASAINNDEEYAYTAEANGSLLIVKEWPLVSTASSFTDFLWDYLYDIVKDNLYVDGQEKIYDDRYDPFASKPLDQYEDEAALQADAGRYANMNVSEIDPYYVLWEKPIRGKDNVISVKVRAPKCGEDMAIGPSVSDIPDSKLITSGYEKWWLGEDMRPIARGTIEGGKIYKGLFPAVAAFGYYIEVKPSEADPEYPMPKEEPELTVEGVEEGSLSISFAGAYIVYFSIRAEHDWADWVIDQDDSSASRKCKVCEEKETVALDENPDYSCFKGNETIWTKGSNRTADFVFRNMGSDNTDENTFRKFIGIKVDGTEVEKDHYEAAKGSVKISLEPEYLEGLSEGQHTLEAYFLDGNGEAKFTIVKKSDSSPAYTLPKTGVE